MPYSHTPISLDKYFGFFFIVEKGTKKIHISEIEICLYATGCTMNSQQRNFFHIFSAHSEVREQENRFRKMIRGLWRLQKGPAILADAHCRWLASLVSKIIKEKSRLDYLFSVTLTWIMCVHLSTFCRTVPLLFFSIFSVVFHKNQKFLLNSC